MTAVHGYANNPVAEGFYSNFAGLKIVDQNNQPFSVDQVQSKISLFNFIYTQCSSICHTQTRDLSKVYQALSPALKQNIRFVSVSLDPVKDGPQQLKTYAKQLKADVDGWYFLSSNFFDIQHLAARLKLFKPDYGDNLYEALENARIGNDKSDYNLAEHAATLWLIDGSGQVRQKYVGNPVDSARLAREIRTLHRLEFNQ